MLINERIFSAPPKDYSGRLESEKKTFEVLEQLHIPYERLEHEPAETIAACEEIDRILQIHMCKNLFLCNRQKTEFYLLLMPGEKPFRTKDLSSQIQRARLSFADESFMLDFLNIRPGSVSVMGLMNDTEKRVKLLIDSDLMKEEYIGCHPCVNTGSLKIRMRDILEVFLPFVGHTYQTVVL